jgi:hypothetical protein
MGQLVPLHHDGDDDLLEGSSPATVLKPPEQLGATDVDQTWTMRALPAMSDERFGGCGCVMSDGRLAFLGSVKTSFFLYPSFFLELSIFIQRKSCLRYPAHYAAGGTLTSTYGFCGNCEALVLRDDDDNEMTTTTTEDRWVPLPPMLEARCQFACAAIRGCIIAAGGMHTASAEVYEESSRRWRRLPHDLLYELSYMASAFESPPATSSQ